MLKENQVWIVHNGNGSGDWFEIVYNKEEVYSWHSLGIIHLKYILEKIKGYESVIDICCTDEELEEGTWK